MNYYMVAQRRRQWHPTPVLLPGNSHRRKTWWAAVHGVMKSQTWLSDFAFTFHFYALEKEMATHSSVIAWRIPGMGSHRVGHNWSDLAVAVRGERICLQCRDWGFISGLERSPGEGNGYPFQHPCLEKSKDRGAWWATVHGVAKSWTQLRD